MMNNSSTKKLKEKALANSVKQRNNEKLNVQQVEVSETFDSDDKTSKSKYLSATGKLAKSEDLISFSLAYDPNLKKYKVKYDTGEIEDFSLLHFFLNDLTQYYYNAINRAESKGDKVNLCNSFLDYLILDLSRFRGIDGSSVTKFDSEIEHFVSKFNYLKKRLLEDANVNLGPGLKTGDPNYLPVAQRLIILDELQILDLILKEAETVDQKNLFLGSLLGFSAEYIRKAREGMTKFSTKGSGRTVAQYSSIKKFAESNKLLRLSDLAKVGIEKAKASKNG